MIRTILVPLDGSSFGEYALPVALGIARRTCATLHLAHVCTPEEPIQTPVDQAGDVHVFEEHVRISNYLDGLATLLAERWEVPIKRAILDGPVAETLCFYAQDIRADLLVMTTHGRGPLSRAWMGSIADALLRRLPLPLLYVRPRAEAVDILESVRDEIFRDILLPLDGSPMAEEILAPALGLGTLMQAHYTLLQVIEPIPDAAPPVSLVPLINAQRLESRRLIAQLYLDGVAARLRDQGLTVTTQTLIDNPAEAIVNYARAHASDLIAMATHGRGGMMRLLMGSVADTVARSGVTPLLLYRPRPGAQAERSHYVRRDLEQASAG